MKVVIRENNDCVHFMEITEEQYKFWEWMVRDLDWDTTIGGLEIDEINTLTFDTIE